MDPADQVDHDERGGPAALERARALLHLGRPADALHFARQAVVADPASAEAECTLAICCERLADAQAAIHHAGRASALAPDWDAPHRVRSRALLSIGHRKEAEGAAARAVTLAPWSAAAHCAHAVALAELPRRGHDALVALERAVALEPDDADVHVEASYVAILLERWGLAEEYAQRALQIRPDDSAALNNLGTALGRGKAKGSSLDHFARSARLDPSNVASDNARVAAADLAGHTSIRTWFLTLYLALLGCTAVIGLTPESAKVPVGIAVVIGAVVAALMWRERRRRQVEQLSEQAQRLVAVARLDPPPQVVARYWSVFGVSVLLAMLFFADLFSPAPDANLTVNWIAIAVFGGAAGWTGWRLAEIRNFRQER